MATKVIFNWSKDDCERLKRSEMEALRWLLAMLSVAEEVKDGLRDRFKSTKSGAVCLRLAIGLLHRVCNEVLATTTEQQHRQIQGTMRDYELRLQPRLTPRGTGIVLSKENGVLMLECMREKCLTCAEDGVSCRKCKLYQFLEATSPLDDYGDGILCPYAVKASENQ